MTKKEALANFQVIKDQIEHFGEVFFDESDIPMIDVVIESLDGVHGEWIPMGDVDKDNNQLFQCSNCGGGDLHAVGVEVPYCWFCGANMRGGHNECE